MCSHERVLGRQPQCSHRFQTKDIYVVLNQASCVNSRGAFLLLTSQWIIETILIEIISFQGRKMCCFKYAVSLANIHVLCHMLTFMYRLNFRWTNSTTPRLQSKESNYTPPALFPWPTLALLISHSTQIKRSQLTLHLISYLSSNMRRFTLTLAPKGGWKCNALRWHTSTSVGTVFRKTLFDVVNSATPLILAPGGMVNTSDKKSHN